MQNDKRKLSPRLPMMNAWGCLFGLAMLAFGLVAGAFVGAFGLPELMQYDVTQTVQWVKIHLMETQQAYNEASLNMTVAVAQNQGTQSAMNFEATQMALGNAGALLNQTATQSALFGQGTATARADQYNQALTQIALDQQGTQVGMQQNGTQVQQSLENEATKVQLNFQATLAAIQGQPLTATPQAQAQSAPQTSITGPQLMVVATDTPIAMSIQSTSARVSSDFANGMNADQWIPSRDQDWTVETGGIRAVADGVVMASRQDFASPLEIDVMFTPALSPDSDYRILFGRDANEGYEITLNAAALSAHQITLAKANGELILSNGARGALTASTHLILSITADQITVTLNDETVLTAQLPTTPNGNVAVSFPRGAFLKSIQVR